LPNPESPSIQEYEFIGKLIGKAVYESITIEQKFVEPFMNLVIGRKNAFEDIQYIDPAIYQSLIGIKHMPDNELEGMQQTFVIQDQLPNGKTSYVNLLQPSKPVKGTEDEFALVNRYLSLQYR
jgi:ubiquitin-protein ligase E3 C